MPVEVFGFGTKNYHQGRLCGLCKIFNAPLNFVLQIVSNPLIPSGFQNVSKFLEI